MSLCRSAGGALVFQAQLSFPLGKRNPHQLTERFLQHSPKLYPQGQKATNESIKFFECFQKQKKFRDIPVCKKVLLPEQPFLPSSWRQIQGAASVHKGGQKWIRLLKSRIKNKEKVSLGSQSSSRPWLLAWCTYSICSGCTCKEENFHLLEVLRVWKFGIIYLRMCDQKCYPFRTEKFQCIKKKIEVSRTGPWLQLWYYYKIKAIFEKHIRGKVKIMVILLKLHEEV